MRIKVYFLLFACLVGCDLKHPDYIGMVQHHASSYPGVQLKQYVEDLAKTSRAIGNDVKSGGWTWERSANGHIVKYVLEENGVDQSFIWQVDDGGQVIPQNKLASDATP